MLISKWSQLQNRDQEAQRESTRKDDYVLDKNDNKKKIITYRTDHPTKRHTEVTKRISQNGQGRRPLNASLPASPMPHLYFVRL